MMKVYAWPLVVLILMSVFVPSESHAQSFSSRVLSYFKNDKTQEVPSWVVGVVGLFAGKDPDFLTTKAALLLKRGEFGEAEDIYREVLTNNPIHYNAFLGRGKVALLRGDYELAESSFTRASHLGPEHISPALGLAQTIIAKGEYQRASQFINETIGLKKEFGELKVLQGYIYILREEFERVEENILDGLRFNLTSPIGLIALSNYYLGINEIKFAQETLSKVYEKDRSEALLYITYADIYIQQKNYKEAINILSPLTKVQSKDYDYLLRYGLANAYIGNLEEAEKTLGSFDGNLFLGKRAKLFSELRENANVLKGAVAQAKNDNAPIDESALLRIRMQALVDQKKGKDLAEVIIGHLKAGKQSQFVIFEVLGGILDKNGSGEFNDVFDTLYAKEQTKTEVYNAMEKYLLEVPLQKDHDFLNRYFEITREYFNSYTDAKQVIKFLKMIGERFDQANITNEDVLYPFASATRGFFIGPLDPLFSDFEKFLDPTFLKTNFSITVDQATIDQYRKSDGYARNLSRIKGGKTSTNEINAYFTFSQMFYGLEANLAPEKISELRNKMNQSDLDRSSYVYNGFLYHIGTETKNRETQESALRQIVKQTEDKIIEYDDPSIAFIAILKAANINDLKLLYKEQRSVLMKFPQILQSVILTMTYNKEEELAQRMLDETKSAFRPTEFEKLSTIVTTNFARLKNEKIREEIKKLMPEADALLASKKSKEAYDIYLKVIGLDETNWVAQKQAANYEHSVADYDNANLRVSNLIFIYRHQSEKDPYLAVSVYWLCASHGIKCYLYRKDLIEMKVDDEVLKDEVFLKMFIDEEDFSGAKAKIDEIEKENNMKKNFLAAKYRQMIDQVERGQKILFPNENIQGNQPTEGSEVKE